MANQSSIKQLEEDLWASADTLRAGSKLNSNQYCMPVLGLIFLKYAYGRFKKVEAELLKDRPKRNGVPLPVTERDFQAKSALYLPREAQYDFLLNLPENIASANVTDEDGRLLSKLGDVVNYSMRLIEQQSEHLKGILPKTYNDFSNELGTCDFVMANPPFNVNGVDSATASANMDRLPFGLPAVNKSDEISNANYLWIQYFYSFLNETGRAGFVMASSATDSQSKDKAIRPLYRLYAQRNFEDTSKEHNRRSTQ